MEPPSLLPSTDLTAVLEPFTVYIFRCVIIGTIIIIVLYRDKCIDGCKRWIRCRGEPGELISSNESFLTYTMDKFLNDMERDKPIRFSSHQLMLATLNYSIMLGSGASGSVYKGVIDGTIVAVKVLYGSFDDEKMEEQFMAEVGIIRRVHHFNLVRLFGFCFERYMRALVYDYMSNGSLDKFLFCDNNILGFEKLLEIAVRTAKGISYLHEECRQRIIHYDIKPGNILLDHNFCPKLSDFGLAKLSNREKSHISNTGLRGTPGYAAPELGMPFHVTHKCDVYSFGMMLFEIIVRRRNFDVNLTNEIQEWLPRRVWENFVNGKLDELITDCGIVEEHKERAENMIRIALWCVQYKPESRPEMSVVVKMLEGSMEIPEPSNPFQYLMDGGHHPNHPLQETQADASVASSSSLLVAESVNSHVTAPIMGKNEIEIVSCME